MYTLEQYFCLYVKTIVLYDRQVQQCKAIRMYVAKQTWAYINDECLHDIALAYQVSTYMCIYPEIFAYT